MRASAEDPGFLSIPDTPCFWLGEPLLLSTSSLSTMARRQHLSLLVALAIVAFLSISYLFSGGDGDVALPPPAAKGVLAGDAPGAASMADLGQVPSSILTGGSIAPKLGNETAKYVQLLTVPPRARPTRISRVWRRGN